MGDIGKILIIAGLVLLIAGIIFILYPRLPLGKLPGDIIIKKGSFTFYFPLATSIIISIILTIIIYFIGRH